MAAVALAISDVTPNQENTFKPPSLTTRGNRRHAGAISPIHPTAGRLVETTGCTNIHAIQNLHFNKGRGIRTKDLQL